MSRTKVIAIANQKGGVGKTTTTANLGYALSNMGRDVLLIDYDSQASLTNYLNIGLDDEETYYGIYDLMLCALRPVDPEFDESLAAIDYKNDNDFARLCEMCIHRPTYLARELQTVDGKRKVVDVEREFGFDLLPSHLYLSDYSLEVSQPKYANDSVGGLRLYNVIQRILKWHEYDYVLIDCNPSLEIMTMNAIIASTSGILIPTNLDLLSTRGVTNLVDRIGDVQELMNGINPPIVHMGVIGILLNLYSERRRVDTTIENNLNMFYPFKIFREKIPESVDAKRAVLGGLIYSQIHKKAKTQYEAVARELEETLGQMEKEGQKIQYLERKMNVVEQPEDTQDNE